MTKVQEPFSVTLTYVYDAASNRTVVQDNFGGFITNTYDAANRLTSRQFNGGTGSAPVRLDLAYSERDQVSTITRYSDLAGTQKKGESAYTYDAAMQLRNLQHNNGSSTVLANYTYTYDLAHRVVTETYNGTAKNYSYDNTDQLTNDGTNAYSFDANGNRTMTGYQTGTNNRITNDGVYTYTYDDQGNLTKKSKGTSLETWNYTYDHDNHQTGVEKHATDGGALQMKATYVYDALRNRVEKQVDADGSGAGASVTTRFAYDGGDVFADLDGSSSLTTRRIYLDTVDSVAARVSSAIVSWYLPDRQGSIRNQTDASGVLSNTITYDGFGKVTNETSNTNGDRYKYTGREQDSESGLQFNRGRYYNPATGTWTTVDPIGFDANDPNLYRYVRNSPTDAIDPTGLADWMFVGWVKGPSFADRGGGGLFEHGHKSPMVEYSQLRGTWFDWFATSGTWGQPTFYHPWGFVAGGDAKKLKDGDDDLQGTPYKGAKYSGAETEVWVWGPVNKEGGWCNTISTPDGNGTAAAGKLEARFRWFKSGDYKVTIHMEASVRTTSIYMSGDITFYFNNGKGGLNAVASSTIPRVGLRTRTDLTWFYSITKTITVTVGKDGRAIVGSIEPTVAGQEGFCLVRGQIWILDIEKSEN